MFSTFGGLFCFGGIILQGKLGLCTVTHAMGGKVVNQFVVGLGQHFTSGLPTTQ